MKKLLLICFACFAYTPSIHAAMQLDTVMTKFGAVSGYVSDQVHIYKGIPFAAPPVGKLRWNRPQDPEPWLGVKTCTQFAASPIQNDPKPFLCWSEEFITPPDNLSEDCLYLNIWTNRISGKTKRPVFVWIYGGGFTSGSAACPIYDGTAMAKKGIVFVSFNYRVGVFGFMAHPELTKEQGSSGNYGLMDQIKALQWIQQNIAAFGGDPDQVTIGGQSAGSMSVQALIASPLAKGLFTRAIAESGALFPDRASQPLRDAENIGLSFQKKLGLDSLADMRSLPADNMLKAMGAFGRMGPILDDYVLPSGLKERFDNGNYNDVPLLAGWTANDADLLMGPVHFSAAKAQQDAKQQYGTKADAFLAAFPAHTDSLANKSGKLLGLMNFAIIPSVHWALRSKKQVFLYQINHIPTAKEGFPDYGAFHTSEVPYVLHTLHTWQRKWQAHDYRVQAFLNDYWVNFIKTGNPNGKGLVEWKPYEANTGAILEVNNEARLVNHLWQQQIDILL